jgi:hypothetical protein
LNLGQTQIIFSAQNLVNRKSTLSQNLIGFIHNVSTNLVDDLTHKSALTLARLLAAP